MSIRRLKNGKWRIRYYGSGTKGSAQRQETLPANLTRAEVDRLHKQRLSEAAGRRGDLSDERLTIEALARQYLEVQGRNMSAAGLERSEQILNLHILPYLGAMRVSALKPIHVEKLRTKRLDQGASPSTVNREWAVLKAVLNWGEAKGLLSRNPIRRKAVETLKTTEDRIEFFQPEEWATFIAAFEDVERWREYSGKVRRFGAIAGAGRRPDSEFSDDYLERLRETVPVFRALLFTGCRLSEILDLRWRGVDFKAGLLEIPQQKVRKAKVIPMDPAFRAELEALPRGVGDARVYVRPNGRPFYDVEIQRAFDVARRIKGLREELTPHSIRHTFASWHVMAGTDLRTVQRLLGHANITTTMRYAHLSPGHLAEAASVIGRTISTTSTAKGSSA